MTALLDIALASPISLLQMKSLQKKQKLSPTEMAYGRRLRPQGTATEKALHFRESSASVGDKSFLAAPVGLRLVRVGDR
jgi:hypothetical protein